MKKPRISLKVALILMSVLCVWLGKIVVDKRREKDAVAWVLKNGGKVEYEIANPRPKWIKAIIDEDYFRSVKRVEIRGANLQDISPLASLKRLESMDLARNRISDLTPLRRLTRLKSLGLYQNAVEDLSPLTNLRRLERLALGKNRVSDITPLKHLGNLKLLSIHENPFVNISSLATLPSLSEVWVGDFGMDEERYRALKKAKPNLRIVVPDGYRTRMNNRQWTSGAPFRLIDVEN